MSEGFVRGFAEVVLNVHDLEAMKLFYQSVFGFALHSEFPEDDPTISFLTVAETDSPLGRGGHPQLLALVDAESHLGLPDEYQGLNVRASSLNHLAFEIDPSDYDRQKQRLEELDLEVRTAVFEHMNAKALFFEDFEGNLLELICPRESKS